MKRYYKVVLAVLVFALLAAVICCLQYIQLLQSHNKMLMVNARLMDMRISALERLSSADECSYNKQASASAQVCQPAAEQKPAAEPQPAKRSRRSIDRSCAVK